MRDRTAHNFAPIAHNPEDAMPALSLDMKSLARQAVDLHGKRVSACNTQEASASLARAIRAAPGTIRSAIYGRLKRVDAALRDKLAHVVMREIQNEIGRLNHELEVARLCGGGAVEGNIAEIEAELETLKRAMGII